MSGRQTNLALLGLTALAFVSGFGAFSVGTQTGWVVVVAHSTIGLATLLVARAKTSVARRGLARNRSGKALSISLAVTASLTVGTGVVQVSGLAPDLVVVTTMQLHVGAGVTLVVLTAIHLFQRPVLPRVADLSRRNLIRFGGLLGAAGLLYVATEAAWGATSAPGSSRRFTGSHRIEDIARVPATQWLNDADPRLAQSHQVALAGSFVNALDLASFDDSVTATLDCTGGWYTTQTWSGARLDRFIGPKAGASIVVRSVTGYWRRFPVDDASSLLLASHVDGRRLSSGHGAPVRLVAPGRRGFWWVKWVDTIEVDNRPPWWQPPLPIA
jgi:hypothetical protein